jgi:hypothetical protein
MANELDQNDLNIIPNQLRGTFLLMAAAGTMNAEQFHKLTIIIKQHGIHEGWEDNSPKGGTTERTSLAIVQLYEIARGLESVAEPSHIRTLEGVLLLWAGVEEEDESYGEDQEPTRTQRIMKRAGVLGRAAKKDRTKIDQNRNMKNIHVPVTDKFQGNLESANGTTLKIATHLAQLKLGFMTRDVTLHNPRIQPNETETSTALAYLAKACEDGEMKAVTREARDGTPGEFDFLSIYQKVVFKAYDIDDEIKADKRALWEKLFLQLRRRKVKPQESGNTLADSMQQTIHEIEELGGKVDEYDKIDIFMSAIADDDRFRNAAQFIRAQKNMSCITYEFVKKRIHSGGVEAQKVADKEHEEESKNEAMMRPLREANEKQAIQIRQFQSKQGKDANRSLGEQGNVNLDAVKVISKEERLAISAKMGYNCPTFPSDEALREQFLKVSIEKQEEVKKKIQELPVPTRDYYKQVRDFWNEAIGNTGGGRTGGSPKRKYKGGAPWMSQRK